MTKQVCYRIKKRVQQQNDSNLSLAVVYMIVMTSSMTTAHCILREIVTMQAPSKECSQTDVTVRI